MSRLFKVDWVWFIPLFILGIYLSYNLNVVHRQFQFPEIYSDKADYYAYLPATFIYGWDIQKIPDSLEIKSQGFILNRKTNKLEDKTTCGIAILWAPFFLATHFIAVHWNYRADGFSDIYQNMCMYVGVFYLILGLFFLVKFLRNYFSRGISYLTVFLIFAGTNLYYFGIDYGLMSHVNSFFLFCLFLFLLKKFLTQEKKSWWIFVGMSFVVLLAILIRPTNILLFTWMIFLDITSFREIGKRCLLFLKPLYIITFVIAASIVFLPQFMYWKYLTGNFLYYSYPGETFANWKDPLMLAVWFAPLNGFFLYTPLALLFIAGIVMMILKKIPSGMFIGLFFILITYVFASWHAWYFGGSFGYRPFVEYYALLSLPFGYFLTRLKVLKNLYIRSLLIIFIIISVYYNLRLTYHQAWNPYSTWSWDDYLIRLDAAGFYHYKYDSYTYKQDFENYGSMDFQFPQRLCVHSPGIGGYVNEDVPFNGQFIRRLDLMLHGPVKRVRTSIWINPGDKIKTGVCFVFKIQDWKENVFYYREVNFDDYITKPNTWYKVKKDFEIPDWVDQSNILVVNVWNKLRTPITFFDDIHLTFEK